jgi:hypothetical protein
MSTERRTALLYAAGLMFVYLYTFPYTEKTHNANELPRIYLVQAIVDRGVLNIDEGVRRYGYVVDTASYDGHYYSNKAPGLSLLGVPVYAVQRAWHRLTGQAPPTLREQTFALRLFCVSIPQLLFLIVVWHLSGFFSDDKDARRAALVGYALGTLALPFSLLYMSHQPAAALIGTAFLLLAGKPHPARLALAGLCMTGSVLMDYQSAFFCLPLGVYALVRVRPVWRLGIVALGAVPPVAALAAYHRACFGSALRTGYAYSTVASFRAIHHQGLLGLTRPSWSNFFDTFLAIDNGLFVLSTWLLLGCVGIALCWRARRRRAEVALCGGMFATAIGFMSSLLFARGGWAMGPRYIAIAVPFLAAPAASTFAAAAEHIAAFISASALRFAASLIYVGSALVFPLWPDKLRNPFVELSWPLLRDGYAPYSIGWLLHVPPRFALVPAFAIAAVLVLGPMRSFRIRVAAAVVGCALVALLWLGPRSPRPDSEGVLRWVESIWEP